MKRNLKVYLNITLGVLCVAVAYYFLFLPQNIMIGGVTGLSVIFHGIFGDGYETYSSLVILALNILFLLIGLIFFGKEFFIKTLYGTLLLPGIIAIFEFLPVEPNVLFTLDYEVFKLTSTEMNPMSQMILAVLLGSILTGVGLGLCFRVNATTGGMDILQKILAKLFHIPYSKTVYFTDGVLVVLALFVFGLEMLMYNLISIIIIGYFIDLVHMGGANRRTAFILSKENEKIKKVIIDELGRGVTLVPSYGGYSGYNYEMLMCTLSRNESYLLRDRIHEIDPTAFTFYVSAKEVYGDGFEV